MLDIAKEIPISENIGSQRNEILESSNRQKQERVTKVHRNDDTPDWLVRELASPMEVEILPLNLNNFIQEVSTPKPRHRENEKNVKQRNANGNRIMQIATHTNDKERHEIMPKDYKITSINLGNSCWQQELEEIKVNLNATIARVQKCKQKKRELKE